MIFTKTQHLTPPPQPSLPILEKAKSIYKNWIKIHHNIPRTERFGIGTKTDILFLELLELLRKTVYASINEKIKILEEAISALDSLRFFVQLLWETKLISNGHYAVLGTDIESLGKMIGGWRKGLLNKTSAIQAEERKE